MDEATRRIWLDVWAPAQGQVFESGHALEERVCELYNERLLGSQWWQPGMTYKYLLAVAVAEGWLLRDDSGRTVVCLPLLIEPERGPRGRVSALAG